MDGTSADGICRRSNSSWNTWQAKGRARAGHAAHAATVAVQSRSDARGATQNGEAGLPASQTDAPRLKADRQGGETGRSNDGCGAAAAETRLHFLPAAAAFGRAVASLWPSALAATPAGVALAAASSRARGRMGREARRKPRSPLPCRAFAAASEVGALPLTPDTRDWRRHVGRAKVCSAAARSGATAPVQDSPTALRRPAAPGPALLGIASSDGSALPAPGPGPDPGRNSIVSGGS